MLGWLKRHGSAASYPRNAPVEPAKPPGRAMSGKYVLLYKYLENRYANTVVLTFAEIEDLLGFTLPERARVQQDWWANENPQSTPSAQSRSWLQASRTASPNLQAQTVVFDRG